MFLLLLVKFDGFCSTVDRLDVERRVNIDKTGRERKICLITERQVDCALNFTDHFRRRQTL